MKKITLALLMVAGLGASFAASAAPTPFTAGEEITSGSGNLCALLSESVTLNLSKNVLGAFDCNTTYNVIRIATCHANGSLKAASLDCAVVGFMADGKTPVYNGAGCDSTPGKTYTQSANARVFEGSSNGGSVVPADLGATCTAAPITATFFTTY